MIKLFFASLLFSNMALAQIAPVTSGNLIEASKINELINKINKLEQKVVPLGTIFSSLLDETQYQAENGNCWVKMNNQSIAGTDFATLTGMNTLPNAQGRFLRNIGGDAAPLRTTQDDLFKSHDHGIYTATNSNQSYNLDSRPNYNQIGNISWQGAQDLNSRTDSQGGIETRPKNLSVNFFIKVNRICNFN